MIIESLRFTEPRPCALMSLRDRDARAQCVCQRRQLNSATSKTAPRAEHAAALADHSRPSAIEPHPGSAVAALQTAHLQKSAKPPAAPAHDRSQAAHSPAPTASVPRRIRTHSFLPLPARRSSSCRRPPAHRRFASPAQAMPAPAVRIGGRWSETGSWVHECPRTAPGFVTLKLPVQLLISWHFQACTRTATPPFCRLRIRWCCIPDGR
jgi:hypothetical protein